MEITKEQHPNRLKKDLATCQALIKLMEDLFSKAKPRMDDKEIKKYERFMKELRMKESSIMDRIFRAGGNLRD